MAAGDASALPPVPRRVEFDSSVAGYTEAVKVREVIRLLERGGWYLDRTRGSHRQFRHAEKVGTVTVAGKPSLDLPPGTLRSILRQAGLIGERE